MTARIELLRLTVGLPDRREYPVCGRCGVYQYLHPRTALGCEKPRRCWWWDRHYLHRHLLLPLWLATPSRVRWRYAAWLTEHTGRDWCGMVDCCLAADRWREDADDYRCACDVSLPWDIGAPDGTCYCPPRAAA